MEAKIQKWGNSLGIRIPINMIKGLSLRNGSIVDIDEESDRLIIRPKEKPNLDDLLDAITMENLHSEIDFGNVEGNEVW
ncbi:MAG: AbrB/MazE/SpoVT family DNA-binding domain-containing protein [Spirochaetales bacterium]|nr:AbrB/MazE/SpoVT family DNA-binding domain-containing protein [Spirochaetales bacterium]